MNKTLFKQSILTLSFLFSVGFAFSQAPEKLSYQSVIRRTNNDLVVNQNVRVKISILQGTISGTAVYVEDHTTSTNSNGLVSLSIGVGNNISGSFSAINWENGPYFVKMEADPTGGTNYTVSGTSQLLSVPYALYAKSAGNVSGVSTSGCFTHYIGEYYGGGVIFHLWKDGQGIEHGLIVDLTDFGPVEWSNVIDESIGTAAQSSWDGLSNSIAIVSQIGHLTSAAELCLNSVNGGMTDWYLPSISELSLLFQNRYNVEKSISDLNGTSLTNSGGWQHSSSTEFFGNANWCYRGSWFDPYGPVAYNKEVQGLVRAIRSF